MVPDLVARRGPWTALVCGVRSPAHGRRLANIAPAIASGDQLVFVGSADSLRALVEAGAVTAEASSLELPSIASALEPLSGGEAAAAPGLQTA